MLEQSAGFREEECCGSWRRLIRTILQSATARRASLLSRRSGSLDGGLLLIWKMVPADLGRFLRPFGAELMHTHQVQKLPWYKMLIDQCAATRLENVLLNWSICPCLAPGFSPHCHDAEPESPSFTPAESWSVLAGLRLLQQREMR